MSILLSDILKALPVAIISGIIAEFVTVMILKMINQGEPLKTVAPLIWISGIFRATVIALYFITLFYFFSEKWAIGSTTTVFIIIFSMFLIIGFGLRKFSSKQKIIIIERVPTNFGHITRVIYLTFTLSLCVWLVDRFSPHYVAIHCQENVGTTCTIRGKVTRSNRHVRILVRAASDNVWYTQQTPVVDEKGIWESVCVFRGQEGQVYKILAVASSDSIALEQGNQLLSEQIPKNVRLSSVCTTKIK